MFHPYPAFLLLAIFAGTAAMAQEDSGETEHPCFVRPIFHCVKLHADGSATGHFGYDMQCPEDLEDVPDLNISIGEDNYFNPATVDSGLPILFLPGKHVDEFEIDFSEKEIKEAKDMYWAVKKISTSVDFSKTKDDDLNCETLPY
jgi:hypothetical protein